MNCSQSTELFAPPPWGGQFLHFYFVLATLTFILGNFLQYSSIWPFKQLLECPPCAVPLYHYLLQEKFRLAAFIIDFSKVFSMIFCGCLATGRGTDSAPADRGPKTGRSMPQAAPCPPSPLIFFVTTCPGWVICHRAAFLWCGSLFSCSVSGIDFPSSG